MFCLADIILNAVVPSVIKTAIVHGAVLYKCTIVDYEVQCMVFW